MERLWSPLGAEGGLRDVLALLEPIVVTLGAAVLLGGCDGGDRAEAAAIMRDSAGITIVENEPGAGWGEGEGWRLAAEPLLDIGVLEGEEVYQLYNARDAARLSDGRIVIANAGTYELRFYDADGSHVRSVGREGGGPGEFQQISGLEVLAGDTMAVWDQEALRLSHFAPDGEFVRTASPALGTRGLGLRHHGTFGDGSFVLRPDFVISALTGGDGVRRDTTPYTRYDAADGALLDTVAVTPGTEVFVESGEDVFNVTVVPFARGSHLDVHGDHAYVGVSDRFEIRVIDVEALVRRVIRLEADMIPVTDADVRRLVEANTADQPPEEGDDPDAFRRTVERMVERPRPETFPMFDALVVDDLGVVWVREHEPPGVEGPRHWLVFDADGRLLGTVQMPRGLTVYQIGPDFVLGRVRDDFDIEHITLYELIRSPA